MNTDIVTPHETRQLIYAKGSAMDFAIALLAACEVAGVKSDVPLCSVDFGFSGTGVIEICRTSSGVHVREVEAM